MITVENSPLAAAQSYNTGSLCELNRYQVLREIDIHSQLDHEHVIKLFAAFEERDKVGPLGHSMSSGRK